MKGFQSKSPDTKRKKNTRLIISVLNLILSTSAPNIHRPIDYLASHHFPSVEKLGQGTRNLSKPFSACHLIEQRKALGALHALLSRDADFFGFGENTILNRDMRRSMHREKLQKFDELFYEMAWMRIKP